MILKTNKTLNEILSEHGILRTTEAPARERGARRVLRARAGRLVTRLEELRRLQRLLWLIVFFLCLEGAVAIA